MDKEYGYLERQHIHFFKSTSAMHQNDIFKKLIITLQIFHPHSHELHALWWARQHQLQPNVNYTGRHVGEGDPEKLGIPAGAVSGAWVGSGQSVLHAAGHLGDVSVADCIHDQTLDLDVWEWEFTWNKIFYAYKLMALFVCFYFPPWNVYMYCILRLMQF